MRILALVPARGGSKRLPGKNIRILGGKPMIFWSIDVAKEIAQICDILVSTDDPAIAALGVGAGAYVPWLRPKELASDTTSSVDVALHALDFYEAEKGAVDGLLLLQPTSPFREKGSVLKGIELFKKNLNSPVISVSETHVHPMWTLKIDGGFVVPFLERHGLDSRSQDLPKGYAINGCLYLISPTDLRAERSFINSKTVPLLIESQKEALDIDTEIDYELAKVLFKNHELSNNYEK
jgi:CMP-N,N'-diacetyllegionaminic acid synthase